MNNKGLITFSMVVIGIFFLFLMPEIDSQNDEPIYVNIKAHELEDNYVYYIRIRHSNYTKLISTLKEWEPGLYETGLVEIILTPKTKEEYIKEATKLHKQLQTISTNIKYNEAFKNVHNKGSD